EKLMPPPTKPSAIWQLNGPTAAELRARLPLRQDLKSHQAGSVTSAATTSIVADTDREPGKADASTNEVMNAREPTFVSQANAMFRVPPSATQLVQRRLMPSADAEWAARSRNEMSQFARRMIGLRILPSGTGCSTESRT